jgi:hypothetical protein
MNDVFCFYIAEQMVEKTFQETIAAMKKAGEENTKKMLPTATAEQRKLLLDIALKNALGKIEQEEKTAEQKTAPVSEPTPKFRRLTLEDFDNGLVDDDNGYSYPYAGEANLAEVSRLRKHGYSVSKSDGMTKKQRQDLLRLLIETGEVEQSYVINYLNYMIKLNEPIANKQHAVACWRMDLDFVLGLPGKYAPDDELPF